MVRANRRFAYSVLAVLAAVLALGATPARAECSDVGAAQVGECEAPRQAASGAGGATPADAEGAAARFYSLVNGERANRGLSRLSRNAQLERIAHGHAKRMADKGKIYHNDALFSPATVQALGNPTELGENVGRGPSVDDLHATFMKSKSHRVNVLDRSYAQAGIAVVYGSGQLWVVETFMSPAATRIASRVWAGGSVDDVARAPVLRFSGPAVGAWRWSAPAYQEQEAFDVPLSQVAPQVLGVRETIKALPGGATGIAFGLAFATILGTTLGRRRREEDYV